MTPDRMLDVLTQYPFPGASDLCQSSALTGGDVNFRLGGALWRYFGATWIVGDRTIPVAFPAYGNLDDGDRAHVEIRRVLAELAKPVATAREETAPPQAQALADILRTHPYPGVSGVSVTDDGDLEFTLDGATVPLDGELWRLDEVEVRLDADGWNTSGLTRRCLLSPSGALTPDAVHAEIGRVLRLAAESPHTSARQDWRLTDEIDRRKDVEAQLAKMTDAHAVVSQRLVGAQREVADLEQQRDALADAGAALSEIASLCGVRLPATPAHTVEAVSALLAECDSFKARLRGAEGSIETLSGLLDVLAAPVAFGERRLSPAERAEWALRRWLAEGRASDTRIAQLIEAEVYLDVLGVPAYAAVPSDDPGDASEALTLPERLRLHFGGNHDRQGRSSR